MCQLDLAGLRDVFLFVVAAFVSSFFYRSAMKILHHSTVCWHCILVLTQSLLQAWEVSLAGDFWRSRAESIHIITRPVFALLLDPAAENPL